MEDGSSLDDARGTGRLEAFSDGVFAVAITLLVLDVHVPQVQDDLGRALIDQWSTVLGYATSFVIIGLFWANHHYMFKYITRTNQLLLLCNTLMLMCLAFIPFSTALLSQYMQQPGQKHLAAVIYSGVLLLTSLMYNVEWQYAVRRRLIDPALSATTIRQISGRYFVSLPLYALSIVIALVSVEATLVLYLVLAAFYAVPAASLPFGRVSATTTRHADR